MANKEINFTKNFGVLSKAAIFEELIWKILGKKVKLIPVSEAKQQRGEIYYGNCKKED